MDTFLVNKVAKLYGNANITLRQAAAYANTPEKRNLVLSMCTATLITFNCSAENANILFQKCKNLFPPLNHREQA